MLGILLADEDRSSRLLFSRLLDGLPVAVYFEADNGESALEQARRFRPDLIILDMMLPIINGVEACTIIKTDPTLSHIPVILVTACDEAAYRYIAHQARPDAFIAKPFDAATLRGALMHVMRSRV